MCLFTHFAAGALAGGATGNSWFAVLAGLASHALLDAIPHYDHPDWRLELSGGLASLGLLLLLPISSGPAVVGGIFGMVPDLENLFQKLGKVRRDQFLFPSHTGLIPHGRELGPRTLVWQVLIFIGCFLALGLLQPTDVQAQDRFQPVAPAEAPAEAPAVMALPEVDLLVSRTDLTRVRVRFPVAERPADWGAVDPQAVRWLRPGQVVRDRDGSERQAAAEAIFTVAIPTRQRPTWRVVAGSWHREPDNALALAEVVTVAEPLVFRGVPLASVQVAAAAAGGIVREIELELQHPPQGPEQEKLTLADAAEIDVEADLAPSTLVNRRLFSLLTLGSARRGLRTVKVARSEPADWFGLTSSWVKLSFDQTRVYRLTGSDLEQIGVPLTQVDPAKLRLYRGGNIAIADDPEYPDSLQTERLGLSEVAIAVQDGDDGEFNLTDQILFYGVGIDDWLDRFQPGQAARLDHYDHPYAAAAVYWLTWTGYAEPSPLPGTPRRIPVVAAPPLGGERVDRHLARHHEERNYLDAYGLFSDNWGWDNTIIGERPFQFWTPETIPGESAMFVVDYRCKPPREQAGTSYHFDKYEALAYLNDDIAGTVRDTLRPIDMEDSLRVRLVGNSTAIRSGNNVLNFAKGSGSDAPWPLVVDAFDLLYWTPADMSTWSGAYPVIHWGDQVPETDYPIDLTIDLRAAEPVTLWDVTYPDSVVALVGVQTAEPSPTLVAGLVRQPGDDRHLLAFTADDVRTVDSGERVAPLSLRGALPAVDYVVIYHERFAAAAERLADLRTRTLPGVANPAAIAVEQNTIYDNYSGGQKDLYAVRYYLRKIFNEGGQRLRFVCFLGDASWDYRNYLDHDIDSQLYDFVPTEMRTTFPQNPYLTYFDHPYSTDDGTVSFDTPPPATLDIPDLADGRIPVRTVAEADAFVTRCEQYAEQTEPGIWRNRVLMVADDLEGPSHSGQYQHTWQAERLANLYLPGTLDVDKVYLVAYDPVPGGTYKPAARTDINLNLNGGTTIYHYIGHGGQDILADEQVFLTSDIYGLSNGMQRSVFLAFSCDVGIYASPFRQSMAEIMVLQPNGGGIGSITASQISIITYNNYLSNFFYENLFDRGQVDAGSTIGLALVLAKADIANTYNFSYPNMSNSQRYSVLGDPAVHLPHPVDDLEFAATSIDTLRSGVRQQAVIDLAGQGVVPGGDVTYDLHVQESSTDVPYYGSYNYVELGARVFRGNGPVETGQLEIPFKVPVQLRAGDRGRLRLVIHGPDGDRSCAATLPVVRQATGEVDDFAGPDIALAFNQGGVRVRPGALLTATVADTSGVSIQGSTAGNSVLLELDDSGLATDVSGSFQFDPGSYERGTVSVSLPADLELGAHKVSLHATDLLGNAGSDTLSFQVVPEGVAGIVDATVFPNPTSGPCRLVFELSDPMDVSWDIYTLGGDRIKQVRQQFPSAGPKILQWDGRDAQGDEIANGVYLYVLRGSWPDNGGHDAKQTGKLVIMR